MKEVVITNTQKVLQVTISRPAALNALNAEVINQLCEVMEEIDQNHDIRGAIITGEGDKAFVAGADIKELAELSEKDAFELSQSVQGLLSRLENCPKPIIAAVNGFALGGGCELAMACHFRLATANARFGQPEINLGIIPGYGGTQRLAGLIGRGKALELLLTADMVSAEEARTLGLVNHVFADRGDMLAFAHSTLQKIIVKSPIAIRNIIASVSAGFPDGRKGYETESRLFAACTTTYDFREGTTAFIEKRKPVFRGE